MLVWIPQGVYQVWTSQKHNLEVQDQSSKSNQFNSKQQQRQVYYIQQQLKQKKSKMFRFYIYTLCINTKKETTPYPFLQWRNIIRPTASVLYGPRWHVSLPVNDQPFPILQCYRLPGFPKLGRLINLGIFKNLHWTTSTNSAE